MGAIQGLVTLWDVDLDTGKRKLIAHGHNKLMRVGVHQIIYGDSGGHVGMRMFSQTPTHSYRAGFNYFWASDSDQVLDHKLAAYQPVPGVVLYVGIPTDRVSERFQNGNTATRRTSFIIPAGQGTGTWRSIGFCGGGSGSSVACQFILPAPYEKAVDKVTFVCYDFTLTF